jgi:hypothetical protein
MLLATRSSSLAGSEASLSVTRASTGPMVASAAELLEEPSDLSMFNACTSAPVTPVSPASSSPWSAG